MNYPAYEEFMNRPRTEKKPSREDIEAEIASLTKTVNAIPVHRGGRMLKRIAELMRQLQEIKEKGE